MSGIFGIVSKGDCANTLLYGTDYHSHLGTEFGGLAVLGREFTRHIHDVRQGQFKSKFFDAVRHMEGNKGIGAVSALEEQPIYQNSRFGPFCIATNGILENEEDLAARLLKKGISFSEVSRKTVNTTELIAKMKLIPIREVIEGNSIVICEDSIVRGTQLKNFTIKKLWDGDAKEIHARPACPPLMFPCIFNLSTRSINELAARKAICALEGHDVVDVSAYIDHTSDKHVKMVDWIARDLGVTTLRYQTVDDMVKAIGLPCERLCLYCWTGQCPRAVFDVVEANKPARRKQPAENADQKKLW
jgi:glutamine phosphoribosylpyrophosphate amidotransferase